MHYYSNWQYLIRKFPDSLTEFHWLLSRLLRPYIWAPGIEFILTLCKISTLSAVLPHQITISSVFLNIFCLVILLSLHETLETMMNSLCGLYCWKTRFIFLDCGVLQDPAEIFQAKQNSLSWGQVVTGLELLWFCPSLLVFLCLFIYNFQSF